MSWWVLLSVLGKRGSKQKNTCQRRRKKKIKMIGSLLGISESEGDQSASAVTSLRGAGDCPSLAQPWVPGSWGQGRAVCLPEKHPRACFFSITKSEDFPFE